MKYQIKAWIIAVVIFTSAFMAGCTVSTFEGVRLNQKAQIYIEYGQYDQAMELLNDSLDSDNENPATHYWLGQCYQAKGDLEKAIYEYRLAVRFGPSMDLAQQALIETLHQNHQEEESLQATKRYLEHKDAMVWEFYKIAENFRDQGMDGHAALTYEYAQQIEPTNPEPSIRLADMYFDKNDEQKGVEYLIRAFKIDPLYPDLAKRLGEHHYRVDIPQPEQPTPPSPLERELKEMY